jgi:predicted nucleic acid-binding protein
LPKTICDTSPLQYLYQIGQIDILQGLTSKIVVPPSVLSEIGEGLRLGLELPDLASIKWVGVEQPISQSAVPLVADLGPGETEVLMLALECSDPLVILDDARARRVAETLRIPFTGTLGLLIDAKTAGLVYAVRPLLEKLDSLGFRLSDHTRQAVLKIAGESI